MQRERYYGDLWYAISNDQALRSLFWMGQGWRGKGTTARESDTTLLSMKTN